MTGNSYSPKVIKKLASLLLIVGGCTLLIEHLYSYGGFDIELVGHEVYGLAMIILGIAISLKRDQIRGVIEAVRSRDWKKIIDEGER